MTEEELIEQENQPIPGHRPKGESPEEPEPEKKPAAPKVDPEIAKMRKDLARERTRREEAEKATQFWADKAAGATERPAKAAKEEEPVKLSIDLVDAITNGDAKQIKAALKELGFVQKDEVDRDIDSKIGHTKAQIMHEQKLYKSYPELEDEESPLFEKTREIYQDLAKDPTMAKSPKLVEVAARMAKAELRDADEAPRTRKTTRREEPEEDDEPEYEEDRQERVRSQQGSRGRRSTEDPRDRDELSSMQKSIVDKFRAAGADIDEAKYRARAKKGVQMSGLPGRGR